MPSLLARSVEASWKASAEFRFWRHFGQSGHFDAQPLGVDLEKNVVSGVETREQLSRSKESKWQEVIFTG